LIWGWLCQYPKPRLGTQRARQTGDLVILRMEMNIQGLDFVTGFEKL
jgi:hypothetical protein